MNKYQRARQDIMSMIKQGKGKQFMDTIRIQFAVISPKNKS